MTREIVYKLAKSAMMKCNLKGLQESTVIPYPDDGQMSALQDSLDVC